MMIVCDTNVLVSGVLFNGPPRQILTLISRAKVENVISLEILTEAKNVLLRPKFGLSSEQVSDIIDTFVETFVLVTPTERVVAVKNDPDDDPVLEAAQTAYARFIVSGDQHLLSLGVWNDVEILSPAVFVDQFG